MKIGICPKCNQEKELGKHHKIPKRFGGKANKENILYICRSCHNHLEFFIPQNYKMCDRFYFAIVDLFLGKI